MQTALFPDDFLWGAATSAYQIEGSPLADGAGASNWHRWAHQYGHISDGSTGDVACDHYRRYKSDVRLMAKLGLKAYRFSVSWSRIFPEGIGSKNPRGLDFYSRLVDALLRLNIEPFITLHHWDLPAALEDRGGWANRDSAAWFADYAHTLFRALKGRVNYWATLNEPWVVVDSGYLRGVHPPGRKSSAEAAQASRNLLRAHALGVRAFKADPTGKVGIVVNLEPKDSVSEKPEDIAATMRADAYKNRHFLDPLYLGSYPEEMKQIFGDAWPEFSTEDMTLIREPFDFLGVNYYSRSVTRADPLAKPVLASSVRQEAANYTDTNSEVFPEGLTRILLWVKHRYGDIPLFVTENGAAFADPPEVENRIMDFPRVDYFRKHLLAAHRALTQGVKLLGYFAWSLLDNFEWSHGYTKRFGIVGVDFSSQRRVRKLSSEFYRLVIRSRGKSLFS